MTAVGLDIGGANIKLSDGRSFSLHHSFPLWKHPDQLSQHLSRMLRAAPPYDRLAVTMTGELADCFVDKCTGVHVILQSVAQTQHERGASVRDVVGIYGIGDEFLDIEQAAEQPRRVAAANWHALATWATRWIDGRRGILIDIGSTTCDIIPIVDGVIRANGTTDTERMLHSELVYTGIRRSPVCAVATHVPYRGESCPLAQEWFATMLDVYVVLGCLAPEELIDAQTADGRPATAADATRRLARAICADHEDFEWSDAQAMAKGLARAQRQQLAAAIRRVIDRQGSPPDCFILSGEGDFLARAALADVYHATRPSLKIVSLREKLGASPSRCAPAYALAVLAEESQAWPPGDA